jgi:MFS family permease
MTRQTRWGAVFILIFAGVISALQIGKAAIAVPILQRELALTLVAASWIVGAYGVLGAVAGLPSGILSSLVSARTTLIAGLITAGAGSFAGAFAESGALLVATRVLEGADHWPRRWRFRDCCAPSPRRRTSNRCWRCLPPICRSARWS